MRRILTTKLHLPVRLGERGKKMSPKFHSSWEGQNGEKKEKSTILKVLFYGRKEKAKMRIRSHGERGEFW